MKPAALSHRVSIAYSLADQSFAQTKSIGILNLSVELMKHLCGHRDVEKMEVFSNDSFPSWSDLSAKDAVVEVQRFNRPIRSKWGRIMWDQWGVYTASNNSGADWLFLPKGFASFVRRPPASLAVYLHDTMHDFYKLHYPKAVNRFELHYFERCFVASLKQAQMIFTNSRFTRAQVQQVAAREGIELPPVQVAGIGFRGVKAEAVKEDHLVVPVSHWPHKKSGLAVKWLDQWQKESGYAGRIHWVGTLPSGIAWPDHANWRRHGRLAEKEYRNLIHSARALIYFTEYEGFGMPPVEAVLAGVAPVFSRIPATTEATGGRGFDFNNRDYGTFRTALDSALDVSRDVMEDWKSDLLQLHTWSAVADRVVRGLQQAQSKL